MTAPKVGIGIAVSGVQFSEWWIQFATELLQEQNNGLQIVNLFAVKSALPDYSKNTTVGEWKKRHELTDANRQEAVSNFIESDADWIWWLDDDTIPPLGALSRLLSLGREFAAGLYFNPKPPHNPIAYMRRPDGLYKALYGWEKGTLTQIDSVGMGCTLVHKSVYQKIMDNFKVYQRPTGSLTAIHKDDIFDLLRHSGYAKRMKKMPDVYVDGGYLITRVVDPDIDTEVPDRRAFPFYALEYSRTEDHHFCELADRVGIKPWLDTTIICGHLKPKETTDQHYWEEFYKMREEKRI